MGGGVVSPDVCRRSFELHIDDVAQAVLVHAGGRVLNLVTADDRRPQQVGGLVVSRAGDQGQLRIVVAGEDVVFVAAGGLELQGDHLDVLAGVLPPLLLLSYPLGEILARIGGRGRIGGGGPPRPAPRRGARGPGAPAGRRGGGGGLRGRGRR